MKTILEPKPCTRCVITVFRYRHPDDGTIKTDHVCKKCSPLLYKILTRVQAENPVCVQAGGYAQ